MKLNWQTSLVADNALLVPYRKEHVETYHQWMQDPYIQEMTASEPLSIEEEFEMQEAWKNDADKLTFIILDSTLNGAMAGDTNLFFNDSDSPNSAEIEVMVAATESRRKGIALTAIQLIMGYSMKHLSTNHFVAKIADSNEPSMKLFEKLGYKQTAPSNVFQEVTYEASAELTPETFDRISQWYTEHASEQHIEGQSDTVGEQSEGQSDTVGEQSEGASSSHAEISTAPVSEYQQVSSKTADSHPPAPSSQDPPALVSSQDSYTRSTSNTSSAASSEQENVDNCIENLTIDS